MKKSISLIIALVICCLGVTAFAYTDLAADNPYYDSVKRLSDLGIVSGYDDGSFHPDDAITRAEFATLVVAAMDAKTEAKAASNVSAFHDVEQGSWAAPYINYVASKSIVAGYSDGSFGPQKTITYAETLTVLLKVMGYTESTLGYFWPNNYIDGANSLGITEGMYFDANQPMTRLMVAVLIDRAMFSEINGSKDVTLLESIGYKLLEDTLVIDIGTDSRVHLVSDVKLTSSTLSSVKTKTAVNVGDYAEYAVIDEDGDLVTMKGYDEIVSKSVIVSKLSGNTVTYISEDGTGSYKFDSTFTTYYDQKQQTFENISSKIKNGTDITFYGEEDKDWSFAVVGIFDDIDPVLARSDYSDNSNSMEGITINHDGLIVYRDGEAASLGDIQINDVVYYNTRSNVMDVYTKKITGIYYEALPSKAYVESVVIGNKEYPIGFDAATAKLDASSGSFEIGDKVTLLLGKDDEVVFAVELSDFDYFDYGIVTSTGTRISENAKNEGESEIIAEIFMPDGETYTMVTEKDYDEYIGALVHLYYEDGVVSMTKVNTKQGSGELDLTNRTLNGKTILKDAKIIQRNSYDEGKSAEAVLLDFEDITATEIEENQLLGLVTGNSFGDIMIIYVEDLENTYTYGVIGKTVKDGNENISGYKIYNNADLTEYKTNVVTSGISVKDAVGYKLSGGSIDKIIKLYTLKTASSFDAIEGSRIKIGDTIYKMSADVQIIDISDSENFTTLSVSALSKTDVSKITLYSDKSLSNGGIVRVITITQ